MAALRVAGASPASQMQPSSPQVHDRPFSTVWPANACDWNGTGFVMAVFREQNGIPSISAVQPSTTSSLFIDLPSSEIWTNASSGQTRCQRAISTLLARARFVREEIEYLCRSLAAIAAQAHALKDVEAVETASQIMLGLPVSTHAHKIARYYQAFCLNERREFGAAREIVDQLLDDGLSSRLRSRCLLIKGFSYYSAGQIEQSLPFYLEAGRIARDSDPTIVVGSLRMAAVIKALNGDHLEAAAELESLVPLACQIARRDPKVYSALLNSYAVELGETGRLEQALNVASHLAPFAVIHPEFNVTIAELKSKLPTRKHSVVVIHRPAEPVAAPQAKPNPARKRARQSTLVLREAERRFTSLRAPPASRVRPATIPALRNPARQPAKPRAP